MADDGQEKQIDAQQNPEIDQGRKDDDGRQANAGKAGFFDEIAVFEKDIIHPSEHFGEQAPSDHAGTEINAEGERSAFMSRQGRPHEPGKNDRVDDDHRQRPGYGPERAEQGFTVFAVELAQDAAPDEAAILPEGAKHDGLDHGRVDESGRRATMDGNFNPDAPKSDRPNGSSQNA